MRRFKDNIHEVRNMRKMLNGINKKLTVESFIMPEEKYEDDEEFDEIPRGEKVLQNNGESMSGIEKELTQIRKIALSVINRLADQPTSEDYNTMKKIWNLVDRAIEVNNSENN